MPWLVKVPAAVIETLPAAAMSPALVRSPEPASARLPPLRICPALPSVYVTVEWTGAVAWAPFAVRPTSSATAPDTNCGQPSQVEPPESGSPNIRY